MPNAKDPQERDQAEKIFLIGQLGGGKTTQFLTLPRPAFMYIFDPSGFNAIQGHDIDFEEYLPHKLNITVAPIPKGGATPIGMQKGEERIKAQAFAQWEQHFMEALDSGFFEKYNSIGLDSITTLSDIAMDDILAREGMIGYPPQLTHYNVLKTQISRILRALCALEKTLLVTGHTMYKQNDTAMKMMNEILITGDLQVRAPLLFSTVGRCDYDVQADGKKKFTIQTIKDKYNENLKSNIPGITGIQDITISDFQSPHNSGLGYLIKRGKAA
ncbi:hypothetical protein LCGC14_0549730 [marine sediment metagenome]|uniref:Phage nucleotide-binding protein n=1 Tax=marine sediment metagenome TaxID=412755 RepID=A0A0F9UBP0_9ZZZZ